jgi:precorrin-6A/cobalt-precorrin-6A reductase
MKRILLLAGTGEARAIASTLKSDDRFDVIASYAGATSAPANLGIETRTGGFGGADGLASFVRDQGIDLLVDATHPFAVQMKTHAASLPVPVLHVVRPAWEAVRGDRWIDCTDLEDAAARLPAASRAFLALGQRHLEAFRIHPAMKWVRSVENDDTDTRFHWIVGSPGTVDKEHELLLGHRITHLVSRNAGGTAGYAKIEAARHLGLPVLMVARPQSPSGEQVATAEEAIRWCIGKRDA